VEERSRNRGDQQEGKKASQSKSRPLIAGSRKKSDFNGRSKKGD